jgi:hypothetical protein
MTAVQPTPTDKLAQLVGQEIRKETQRLSHQDANLEQLKRELVMTVLPIVQDLGSELLQLRGWANEYFNHHADQLDDHEARLTVMEDIASDESRLDPDDAELFAKLVAACEVLAEQALATTTDPSGKKKLEEVLEVTKQARERLVQIVEGDEDDEGEEGDEDAEGEVEQAAAEG